MHIAVKYDAVESAEILLAENIDVTLQNSKGQTALQLPMSEQMQAVFQSFGLTLS